MHDMKNLLGIIIGYSNLLLDEMPPDDPKRSDLDEIRNAGDSAIVLLNDWDGSARDLVRGNLLDRSEQVFGLRQDHFLELGRVCDGRIHRANASDGRIQILEQIFGNARGDLGAEAARQLIFVRDDHAAGPLHGFGNRLEVVRARSCAGRSRRR